MPGPKSDFDEEGFKKWYQQILDAKIARGTKIDPNPEDPRHFYDYRAAFSSGVEPSGDHLPSAYKLPGHPRIFLKLKQNENGEWMEDPKGELMNTTTMKPATEEEAKHNDDIREQVMKALKRLEK